MKTRFTSIFLAVIVLFAALPLGGCALFDRIIDKKEDPAPVNTDYGSDTLQRLAENAIQLATTGDPELMKKLLPKGEIDYYVDYYDQKGQDYWQLLRQEFEANIASYNETCGSDWVITYEVTQQNDKDSEGIQKYREFDSFYFEEYGIDPAKITAVSYVYYTVSVNGSEGSGSRDKSMYSFEYEGRWYSFYMPRFGLKLV